jgi:hypothetical protein
MLPSTCLAPTRSKKKATSSKRPSARGGVCLPAVPVGGEVNNAPDIDLTTLIPQLDTVAADIVTHQRDTLTQRKDLAQKTKDFRKLDDASKLNDIKGLLKCKHGRAQTRRHC